MKMCENGIYRDMTAEEIAALDTEEPSSIPPTAEELAAAIAELQEALELLLSGATE